MESTNVIKSYVWYKNDCFFVSTMERDSSASTEPPGSRFNETIVWVYDYENKERKEMISVKNDRQGSIETHNEVCLSLNKFGMVMVDDD